LEILEEIKPHWAIISSGVNNYGHPETSTLANLNHIISDSNQLLLTNKWGTLELQIKQTGYFWPQVEPTYLGKESID
jgi:beta-lactamase superfamily II metal-dependent hydrolase